MNKIILKIEEWYCRNRALWKNVIFVVLVFTSCINQVNTKSEQSIASSIKDTSNPKELTPKILDEETKTGTMEVVTIEGTWQHETDKYNLLSFGNKHRTEIAEGKQNADEDEYYMGEICNYEENTHNYKVTKKSKIIICPSQQMCWEVISLTKNYLILNMIGGRGNTLKYYRIK